MFTKFSQSPGARHVLGECRCFLRIEEAAGACQDTCCMLNPFNRSHEIPRHSITLKICSEKPFFFLGREDLISNHLVRGLSFQPCVVRDPRGVHLKSVALVISAMNEETGVTWFLCYHYYHQFSSIVCSRLNVYRRSQVPYAFLPLVGICWEQQLVFCSTV